MQVYTDRASNASFK
nr:unnamed protein product [Callosobruchus analis]